MRLSDLNPHFLDGYKSESESESVKGVGIEFDCPCGNKQCIPIYVQFANVLAGVPYDMESKSPRWQRTGDTFETITLKPSIRRISHCGWHGWVTDGNVTSC